MGKVVHSRTECCKKYWSYQKYLKQKLCTSRIPKKNSVEAYLSTPGVKVGARKIWRCDYNFMASFLFVFQLLLQFIFIKTIKSMVWFLDVHFWITATLQNDAMMPLKWCISFSPISMHYNISKTANFWNPIAPLLGEIEICEFRVFFRKFNSTPLLFEAFFDIISDFCSIQHLLFHSCAL